MSSTGYHISSKVEAATNEMLIDPNWGANMEICDMFNRDPSLGQALIRSLTLRIKHKDPKTGVLAIQLLEALVKNCPHFHKFVAGEDFMHTLVKTAKGKYANSKGLFSRQQSSTYEENNRIEKTLLLVQSLGKSFANSKSYPIFKRTYSQLKREGLRFPEPLKDEGAPIFSPPAKKPDPVERKDLQTNDNLVSPDMRLAQENAVLLYTMLDSSPKSVDLRKDELMTTLINTCRAKHREVLKVVSSMSSGIQIAPEKVSDALAVNDVLTQVIEYYDGLVAGKLSRKKPESSKKKKDKEKEAKAKKGKTKKKAESESEASEYSDSESEEEDMLGFGASPASSKRSPKAKSKRKGVKDKKDKHKEVPSSFPPPRLAPPSGPKKGSASTKRKVSDGSSDTTSPRHAPSDDADDLLDFADLHLSNGGKEKGGDDFFSFESPPKTKGGKKTKEPAPASGGDDGFDDDEFFAIASRHAEPEAAPMQSAPPQTASNPFDDDAFFAEIGVTGGGAGASSSTNNGNYTAPRATSHPASTAPSSGGNFLDEFDPLS